MVQKALTGHATPGLNDIPDAGEVTKGLRGLAKVQVDGSSPFCRTIFRYVTHRLGPLVRIMGAGYTKRAVILPILRNMIESLRSKR